MNKFNIGDAVRTVVGPYQFVIKFIRLHPTEGLQYGTGQEASILWEEGDLELVSAVRQPTTNRQFRDIDTDDINRIRIPLDFSVGVPLEPRKGFQLVKKTCAHEWKAIQLSDRKTVYDCEHCGIKKEDA
jgi:hypothetical protein